MWSSVDEVAEHLGVARDTVHRWNEGLGLPAEKIGRLREFRLSEVCERVKAGIAHEPIRQQGDGDPSR